MKKPFPFQQDGIQYCLKRKGNLLAMSMGTGKSCVASNATLSLLAVKPEWKRILIVCPATLKQNWVNEWEMWRESFPVKIDTKIHIVSGGGEFPDAGEDGKPLVVVINYDLLHRDEFERGLYSEPWDVIICDESHAIKNSKTIRAKCIKRLKARRKMCLTGTPVLNKPCELWTTLNWLDPVNWNNWKWFVTRYCDAKRGFGNSLDVSGASNLDELHCKLKETVMFRVLKEDVLKDLPPMLRQLIVLPPPETAKPLIDEEKRMWRLRTETIAHLRKQKLEAKIAKDDAAYREAAAKLKSNFSAAMSAMSRIRQELGIAKIPLAVQHIQDALDQGIKKVVVFAHHKAVIAGIADAFQKHGALMIDGSTATVDRQGIVDAFQNDPTKQVIVLSILAAGVGITLTAASHVVMVESDWRPGINEQASARCHRIGQRDSVLVQHLCFNGSLDARMVQRCIQKQEIIDQAIDGKAAIPASGNTPQKPKADYRAIGATMGNVEIQAAHDAMKYLAKLDQDCGKYHNGAGFSKIHTDIGHKLAATLFLTNAQAALAREIGLKYRQQLPPSLLHHLTPQLATV